jgi:hypothetical protein
MNFAKTPQAVCGNLSVVGYAADPRQVFTIQKEPRHEHHPSPKRVIGGALLSGVAASRHKLSVQSS